MLEAGTKVGGYEIEGILGHGGMGVVYEARQVALGRTVALKILSGTLGMDPTFKERFRHEGRIQAGLDHPNIVTIFEAGEWEDSLYIAMRLVRGPNLKEMIIARELEGARTLRILRPIAEALDSAHEAGLIHRDIKPQNILVGDRDRAYLADFGLTKGIDDAGLTRTGQFVGTIDYIAPEQIRGEQATASSDVYALTAVLYECLSGAVPYPKPSDAAVMYAHLSEPPPLVTDQRPELPPNLDEVICKGMDKEPKGRYETASGLIDDAEKALGKRVRAVITPPGPIEGPEEAGIREREAQVPTRPTRVRKQPVPDPAPAGAAPTTPGAPVLAPAAAATAAGATAAAAPLAQPADPTVASPAVRPEEGPAEVPAPADATVASPAVRPEESPAAQPSEGPAAEPSDDPAPQPSERPAPADATVASPAVQPSRTAGPADATVASPAVPLGRRSEASTADHASPAPSRVPWIVAGVAALVIGAVAGYLLGKPEEEAPPARADTGLSSSTTAGALGLRFPGSWERRGEAPAIPGLKLRDQVAVGPGAAEDRGVVAGMSDAQGPLLLPVGFVAALGEQLRPADRVKLGELEALRYEGIEPKGFDRALTVFAAPTGGGVATLACFAPTGEGQAFRADCERVAGSLAVDGETAHPVGPDPQYGKDVSRVVTALNGRRKAGRDVLAKARTPRAQRQAAAALADTYALAAADLRGVESGPVTARANAAIAGSLRNAAAAYRGLARARQTAGFRRATAKVRRAEARVNARLGALKALGYDTG